MTDEAKLSALLGSRICHDLISPIGAIGNGVELLNMSIPPSPELGLIEESVTNANTRIRFFRIAFGSASPGATIGQREIDEVLEGMSRSGRLRYIWQAGADRERAEVKLVFLLMQCLESSMPYGGTIEADLDGDTWALTGTAQKLKAEPGLWSIVGGSGAQAELTPGTVHFALAANELAAQGRTLSVDFSETIISARF